MGKKDDAMKLDKSGRKMSLNPTRVAPPNDPTLSDCGATARPVPGSVAGAQDVTARSSSLQRRVRPLGTDSRT